MENMAHLSARVYGYVQGVNFRYFVTREAGYLRLSGYVRNLPDGAVEVEAEGDKDQLQILVERLKVGPPGARVTEVETSWSDYSGQFTAFEVRF
jgi:acylphosphatase